MKILTFDVEEWFHILDCEFGENPKMWNNKEYRLESNMDKILSFLQERDQKATFFVLGWVAKKFPNIVKKLDELGYELASHSNIHQLAYKQTKKEFRDDLELSIKSIEDVIGKKVSIYRVPGFSIKKENSWAFEEIVNAGIKIDCSVFPTKRMHGGICDFESTYPSLLEVGDFVLKEFPINLFTFLNKNIIFTGGGYFRILPYFFIKALTKRSSYVMTYFHPRDFDPFVPVLDELSFFRKFKLRVGVKNSFEKFKKYIDDFEFIDIKTADSLVDWKKAKVIKID